VVARAWDDDGFRQRLLAEPEGVLREAGIAVPPGVPLRVVEDDATENADSGVYLRLPAKPAADDLMEEDLGLEQNSPAKGVSALTTCHSRCHFCHTGNTGRSTQ
jgi:hypothetical protein